MSDYRFTGQREAADVGLYFFNARWYTSVLQYSQSNFSGGTGLELTPISSICIPPPATAGPSMSDYRFTGQREAADVGLYFFNARWYALR